MNPSFSIFFGVSLLTLLFGNLNALVPWNAHASANIGNRYNTFINDMLTLRSRGRALGGSRQEKLESYFDVVNTENNFDKFKRETDEVMKIITGALSEGDIERNADGIFGRLKKLCTRIREYRPDALGENMVGKQNLYNLFAKAYEFKYQGNYPEGVPSNVMRAKFAAICSPHEPEEEEEE